MERHIVRLEEALAEAREKIAALEREREETRLIERERDAATAQVAALNGILAIERERTAEWKAVADRFAIQAESLASRRGVFAWLRRA